VNKNNDYIHIYEFMNAIILWVKFVKGRGNRIKLQYLKRIF
jgi:hypothetical protein